VTLQKFKCGLKKILVPLYIGDTPAAATACLPTLCTNQPGQLRDSLKVQKHSAALTKAKTK
jgi:hypothetical protein